MLKLFSILSAMVFSLPLMAKKIPAGFTQEKVQLEGVRLNVYKGGSGDPLILIHGYGESGLMWSPAMEKFKSKFTVIVPDLRGGGESEITQEGYTKTNMATDIKKLMDHYKITKARIVGHDIGLMVAYALAAKYPDRVEKLVVMDAFLPGIGPGDEIYNSPDIWHFRFHGPFAEALVKGREKIYLNSLWEGFAANPKSFPQSDRDYYTAQYARPGRMRAGFEYFKAFPQDAQENKMLSKSKLPMPVLSLGGDKALGKELGETMKAVSPNVQIVVLKNTGHWMLEENPEETLQALNSFL